MMFHLFYYTFSSVLAAEWPPFGGIAARGWQYVIIVFCLFLNFIYFTFGF